MNYKEKYIELSDNFDELQLELKHIKEEHKQQQEILDRVPVVLNNIVDPEIAHFIYYEIFKIDANTPAIELG